jgi:hypothetical protein
LLSHAHHHSVQHGSLPGSDGHTVAAGFLAGSSLLEDQARSLLVMSVLQSVLMIFSAIGADTGGLKQAHIMCAVHFVAERNQPTLKNASHAHLLHCEQITFPMLSPES